MRRFQPTVRQLQPLGRRYDVSMLEQFDSPAVEARPPQSATSVPGRPRRRRRLVARTSPSA